jgi:hypothetical protein
MFRKSFVISHKTRDMPRGSCDAAAVVSGATIYPTSKGAVSFKPSLAVTNLGNDQTMSTQSTSRIRAGLFDVD